MVGYYLLTQGTGLVARVFWWQLVARGYGLVDPPDPASPRRRPAFHALKTMVRELDGARLLAVLPAPPPARLYHSPPPAGTRRGGGVERGRRREARRAGRHGGDGRRVAAVFPAGPRNLAVRSQGRGRGPG